MDGLFRLFSTLGICWVLCLSTHVTAQVGINTTDPQQALHIAHSEIWSPLGRMRVESLNSPNNPFNGGDADGDGNWANDLYPLYVDENGDFTLQYTPTYNSGEIDALNDTELPTSTVYLDPLDVNGNESTDVATYTFTVNRAALMEVKYALSFDVYANPAKDKITDNLARRIITVIKVSGDPRGYAPAGTCYSSGSNSSVAGTLYLSSSAFVSLPSAGTYTITLSGIVASNIKSASSGGNPSEETYVEFATGDDFIFIRLY